MILRTPDFYEKFQCIADKCTDTCCIGWEIDIDECSLKKYEAIEGEFGKRLKDNIEDSHFKLQAGDRCPFLNNCGLCEIIHQLGENALCDICREHPRFVEVYGDIKEQGIGLCCEEGVRLLLNNPWTENETVLHFQERNIQEKEDCLSQEVREARDEIFTERENLFTILSQTDISLNRRLQMVLEYAARVCGMDMQHLQKEQTKIISLEKSQNRSRKNILSSWVEILGHGESFGPAWSTAYKQIKDCLSRSQDPQKDNTTNLFSDRDGARIIAYLLFRYYAKSLFDGDSFGKVQFAIFFWLILREYGSILAGENPLVDPHVAAVKLLSKQIEYSEEIMDILAEEFVTNDAFNIEAFNILLQENC